MATRFVFNLEAVLTVRRHERDAQRRVAAEALRAMRAAQRRLAEVAGAIREEMEAARSAQSSAALDVAAIRGHQFYMTRLHGRLRDAQAEAERRTVAAEAERIKLAEAAKRLKAIEKLKERHLARHRVRLARAERVIEDEVAVQQFRLLRPDRWSGEVA